MSRCLDWTWLVLIIVASVVRKVHEHRTGRRTSLKGNPIPEATLMLLWGLAAGVLPLFYMFGSLLDFASYPFQVPVALRLIGVAVFILAIWLLHRSHADLGRHWSHTVEVRPGNPLVVDGVYRRIRHPMYTAHLLWGIAQALLIPNLIAGPLALVLMIAILRIRIPREERTMRDEFGDAYRQYEQRTGRLLPGRLTLPS